MDTQDPRKSPIVYVLLPIHVVAATVALVAGAIALAAAKGHVVHRTSGIVFVYAMVAMCVSAVAAAIVKGQIANIIAGSMTAYLVLTGLRTVRPASDVSRRWDITLMSVALALGAATAAAGVLAIASPRGTTLGLPSPPFFLFGVLGLSGAAGDARVIRSGPLTGAPRLARHLWRMCMALFIATASFFSIRSRVAAIFPAAMTSGVPRAIPVLLVLVAMFYWLWRIRSRTFRAPTAGARA